MIPRAPTLDPGQAPRTWADARALADRLCVSNPPERGGVGRYGEYAASQLVAALLLAAAHTSRPVHEAVDAWLNDQSAIDDTVRPILEHVADNPRADRAHRRDAQAALAIVRRGDHDQAAAAQLVATARRRLSAAAAGGPLVVDAPGRSGKTVQELPADWLAVDGPMIVSSRRTLQGDRVVGRWSR